MRRLLASLLLLAAVGVSLTSCASGDGNDTAPSHEATQGQVATNPAARGVAPEDAGLPNKFRPCLYVEPLAVSSVNGAHVTLDSDQYEPHHPKVRTCVSHGDEGATFTVSTRVDGPGSAMMYDHLKKSVKAEPSFIKMPSVIDKGFWIQSDTGSGLVGAAFAMAGRNGETVTVAMAFGHAVPKEKLIPLVLTAAQYHPLACTVAETEE